MRTIITDEKELAASVTYFQGRMESLAESSKTMTWAFPNGDKAVCTTYSLPTDLGELLVAIPPKWEGRQAHLFALAHSGGVLAPDVEINIPDGLDRRVSGTYVEYGEQVLICHRGGFTAYRGKIPKEISLAYFKKWLIPVDDGGKEADLISITSLASSSLSNDIAEFVLAVSDMKAQFKSGEVALAAEAPNSKWRDGAEYEGDKKRGKSSPPKDYEYLHGPLCNALRRQLKKHVESFPGYEVLSNTNVDVAIVDASSGDASAIFEVKTSSSLSGQLYSALGQLFYYRHMFGGQKTKLFLVLPEDVRHEMKHREFFEAAGVQVIYGEEEKFQSSSGVPLSQVVVQCVRA